MTPASKRRLWIFVALAGFALIVRLTLFPTSEPDTGTFHWCVLCGAFGFADFIANVILFMPVAAGLRGAGVPWRKTVALLLVLSATIELVQLIIPGRESSLSDIISNTLGAAVGAGLVGWWPRRRRSLVAGGIAISGALAVITGAGLVLRPRFPPTVYFGQWTAELGQYEWYRGRILRAQIGGIPLPSWQLPDSRTVRDRLLEGDRLKIDAVAGPRTERLAPLFSIADDRARGILLIGADRDDLVLQVSTSTVDFRLQQPDLRWRGALASVIPGDTLFVELRREGGEYCLRLNARERCGLAYALGEAWGLVQTIPHIGNVAGVALDVLFLAMLGLPFGLLVPRGVSGYAMAGLLFAGDVVLPPLVGMASTPALNVIGLALGVLAGVLTPEGGEGGAPRRSHAAVPT